MLVQIVGGGVPDAPCNFALLQNSDYQKRCIHPLAPSARGLRPQAVGERTVRLSEIFRAMARLSPSAPSGHRSPSGASATSPVSGESVSQREVFRRSGSDSISAPDCQKRCIQPLAPSARGLRPQAVGERTIRLSEIFRAMARLSPSAPSGHLPRRGRLFDGLGSDSVSAPRLPKNSCRGGQCSPPRPLPLLQMFV